ncbi:3916_t:CDS:2, partial [Gigaspora margarita]
QPFYLYTDVSQSGLGAVLAQIDENKREHVIVYAEKKTISILLLTMQP